MSNSAATYVSVQLDVLDCGICMDPLQPPVFQAEQQQCKVGHVICASCHGRLLNKSRCHACSVAGGYHRCIAVEKILEAVRVPCANAVHGCAVTTRYHERAGHEMYCPHKPVISCCSCSSSSSEEDCCSNGCHRQGWSDEDD